MGNSPSQTTSSSGARAARTDWLICLGLLLLNLAVFGQTIAFQFVNYDDNFDVYGNAIVKQGLTAAGFAAALKHGSVANWDPLTTVSHMLDCQVFGLWAGGHHLTNVLLHTASVIVLFMVLKALTGARWPSAFVAAVFAIHPYRAESVAWIAERKDVLSGLFFMLTLAAYVKYARRPRAGTYLLVLACCFCGLLSKAMLVTLPFVLLLLDYWPLRRVDTFAETGGQTDVSERRRVLRQIGRLVWEKVPLFVMVVACAQMAIWAQAHGNTVQTLTDLPLHLRVENAVDSVVVYLGRMFVPSGLAVFYPFPVSGIAAPRIILAAAICLALTAAAWWWRKQRPYLLVGWLWNLIMLAPVIGLIQVGQQAHADRYTYLPQIGVYIAIAWLLADWSRHWRNRTLLPALGGTAVVVLAMAGFKQTSYWHDSRRLWAHALSGTQDNELARYAYGRALLDQKEPTEALVQLQRAVDLAPGYLDARNALGGVLLELGKLDEAAAQFRAVIAANPDYVNAHSRLAAVYVQTKQFNDAVAEYETAFRLEPWNADTENLLGYALFRAGKLDEAIARLQDGVARQPDRLEARYTLAMALLGKGRQYEAAEQLQAVLKIQPRFGPAQTALNDIAWRLATSKNLPDRNGAVALRLADQLVQLSGASQPVYLRTLAAALAENGRFADAANTAGQALQLAQQAGNSALVTQLREQLVEYQAGRPFRDSLPTSPANSR